MTADVRFPARERISTERQILSLLCSNSLPQKNLAAAIESLKAYRWREPEHEIIFQAIRRVGKGGARPLRDELPAALTRMGFPEVSWPRYLAAENQNPRNLDELIVLLIGDSLSR